VLEYKFPEGTNINLKEKVRVESLRGLKKPLVKCAEIEKPIGGFKHKENSGESIPSHT
jgi:hypothetical protein